MTPRVALLLDADGLRVVGASGASHRSPLLAPFGAGAPRAAEALRAAVPRGGDALLIIGAGVLEAAVPALPPVPPDARLPLLRLESDRFLPLPSGAAVALAGPLALGMDGPTLDAWVAAIEEALPVRGVVTLPHCAAWAAGDGCWRCPAAEGEVAEVTVRDGALVEVRRRREGGHEAAGSAARPLDVEAVVEAVRRRAVPPVTDQLLTTGLHRRLAQRRRRAWWAAAGWAAFAVAVLVAGAERRRARELDRLETRERALLEALEPARTARARVARARQELVALAALEGAAASPTAPLRVLAALGEALPKDAFVQRLEWDGTTWRLDGSARDAAALVPRLAAHAGFGEVRTVAPSLQFLDNGIARRSFAITLRPVEAAAVSTPAGTVPDMADAPPRQATEGRRDPQ